MFGKKGEEKHLLTVKEVSKILHINEQSVRECIKRGYLPGIAMRCDGNSRMTYYMIAEDFYKRVGIKSKKSRFK